MKKTADYFGAAIGFIISCLILFGRWIHFQGAGYTIFGFGCKVHKYGGIVSFSKVFENAETVAATGRSIVPAYFFLFLPILLAVVLIVRSVLLIKGKKVSVLTNFAYWIGLFYLMTVFLAPYCISVPFFASLFLMLADYIGTRLILEGAEMSRQARELKQREREAKLDKIRRMHFPGRYSKDFYEVVFANFRSNLRGYLLFIVAASASVALFYVLFGALVLIYRMNPDLNLMMSSGIFKIFSEVLNIVVFLSVMLLVLIISNYIKTRMKNYGIFLGLGIRKKTLWLVIALEYVVCILSSLAVGLLLGNLGFPVLKYLYLQSQGIEMDVPMAYQAVTLVTAIVFLLMTGLATLINYHLFEGVDITSSAVSAAKKEGMPKNHLFLGLFYGLYCIYAGIRGFIYGHWMEGLSRVAILLFGALLILYCGGGKLVPWSRKKKERYFKHMFQILPWKYRFKTNAKYLFLLFTIQTLALSVYLPRLSSCLISAHGEELYPYDFVCMAHEEDSEFFQEMKEDYDIQMETYPMVRIDTLLSEPFSFNTLISSTNGGMFFPLGQQVGISETTYQKLKAEAAPKDKSTLHLRGKEIHVVFQQDSSQRARLLDWYVSPMERLGYDPHLRAGRICYYDLLTRDTLYPAYQIKSQEKRILTGMFHNGDQENIVVFSDEHFDALLKSVKRRLDKEPSPTQLVTLHTAKEDDQEISDKLTIFSQKNASDSAWDATILPYYAKQVQKPLAEGERFFKEIAFSATIFIMLLSSLFIFYLKFSLDIDDLRRRNGLLEAIGMGRKGRERVIRSEMAMHSLWPLLFATAISVIFFTVLPAMRLFSRIEIQYYYITQLSLLLIYTQVYHLGIHFLEKYFIKVICA